MTAKAKHRKPGELTDKQQVFIEHYLICFNGTEAARRAGYSPRTANEQAARLLANVSVQAAIQQRIKELKATTDEVFLRLASHSRGTLDDFIGDFDRIDLDRARQRGKMHLAKKIKQRTTTVSKSGGEDVETHEVEIELYDAQAATVQLGKLLGMFVERMKVEGWQDEIIAALRAGQVTPDQVRAELGPLADDLFAQVGPVSVGVEADAE